jgi:hypothetical protein
MLVFFGFCTFWIGWIYLRRFKLLKPLNIVFDLDNTLIMSLDKKKFEHMNVTHKPIIHLTNRVVWIRPWVIPVIYILSKFCKLYLFTKAEQSYADQIIKHKQLGIAQYFVDCKYKLDCVKHKDIGQFSPSYKKLVEYSTMLKKLEKIKEKNRDVIKLKSKIYMSIKSHQSKLSKFINRTVLVDDKISNKLDGQIFYHIHYYQFGMNYDISMLKLFGWISWRSLINLFCNLRVRFTNI